jgi:hypothetical protein
MTLGGEFLLQPRILHSNSRQRGRHRYMQSFFPIHPPGDFEPTIADYCKIR